MTDEFGLENGEVIAGVVLGVVVAAGAAVAVWVNIMRKSKSPKKTPDPPPPRRRPVSSPLYPIGKRPWDPNVPTAHIYDKRADVEERIFECQIVPVPMVEQVLSHAFQTDDGSLHSMSPPAPPRAPLFTAEPADRVVFQTGLKRAKLCPFDAESLTHALWLVTIPTMKLHTLAEIIESSGCKVVAIRKVMTGKDDSKRMGSWHAESWTKKISEEFLFQMNGVWVECYGKQSPSKDKRKEQVPRVGAGGKENTRPSAMKGKVDSTGKAQKNKVKKTVRFEEIPISTYTILKRPAVPKRRVIETDVPEHWEDVSNPSDDKNDGASTLRPPTGQQETMAFVTLKDTAKEPAVGSLATKPKATMPSPPEKSKESQSLDVHLQNSQFSPVPKLKITPGDVPEQLEDAMSPSDDGNDSASTLRPPAGQETRVTAKTPTVESPAMKPRVAIPSRERSEDQLQSLQMPTISKPPPVPKLKIRPGEVPENWEDAVSLSDDDNDGASMLRPPAARPPDARRQSTVIRKRPPVPKLNITPSDVPEHWEDAISSSDDGNEGTSTIQPLSAVQHDEKPTVPVDEGSLGVPTTDERDSTSPQSIQQSSFDWEQPAKGELSVKNP
ncbi:hypothetical protein FN846DRAFT_906854 [Sphaerosporella brunnea]|uniref:Uncharacterized protein n=1 Tax=Sphaerosporella brunnea TaxID=1250544 RepID=A0A5J5EY33_9PEZI|nr:hypothetical protein FN846DRAFT_906854 [Sphaerosporella brunnea]